jgi:hypothetical protein
MATFLSCGRGWARDVAQGDSPSHLMVFHLLCSRCWERSEDLLAKAASLALASNTRVAFDAAHNRLAPLSGFLSGISAVCLLEHVKGLSIVNSGAGLRWALAPTGEGLDRHGVARKWIKLPSRMSYCAFRQLPMENTQFRR